MAAREKLTAHALARGPGHDRPRERVAAERRRRRARRVDELQPGRVERDGAVGVVRGSGQRVS